jgi:predicted secreted protein
MSIFCGWREPAVGWITGIAVYIVVWWVTVFAVLPWGVRRAENPLPGTVESAPDNPRLGRKFLITTVVAAVLWLVIFALVQANIVDFRAWAKAVSVE